MLARKKQKRNRGNNRREQLINATVQTISETGLSSATLAKVTARAGLSPGIVNFYFKSKKQLLLDTLKYLDTEYTDIIDEYLAKAQTPLQKLHAFIEANFDNRIFVKEKVAVWYAFWSESQAREEYREICGQNDQRENQLVRQCISELMNESEPSEADVNALALGLEGMIDTLWQQMLYDSGEVNSTNALNTCKRYLDFIQPDRMPVSDSNNLDCMTDLLPPWTYRNQEFLEMEIEQLFKPNWMLVGHVSDIPKKGDYLTFEGFNEKALVIRSSEGRINAFHNICRHRGSKILEDEGRCPRALVCPFHGWRYNLEGNLLFIPSQEGFPYINKDHHGLVPIDLEIWKGFIFIRFVSGGESLKQMLMPVENEIKHYQLENLQPYSESEKFIYPVNWKIFHDIDNEGYHVPIGHPTLQQLYGQQYIDTTIENIPVSYGKFNKNVGQLWSVRNYRNLMPEFDHLPKDRKDLWMYIGVFPNLVFALYPDMMEIYMSVPVDLKNTKVRSRVYALPDERRQVATLRYLNRRINKTTDYEDRAYMNTLQEGINSSVFPKWNLSQSAETGVGDFHHLIQEKLPVARLAVEPGFRSVQRVNEDLTETLQ